MGYALGLEVALKERDAALEQLRRERVDIMALKCNACGETFGLHHWGFHGPGPFDGLVCPTTEAQAKLTEMDADRFNLRERSG